MADPVEVLDFWLNEIGPKGWYTGGDVVDAACKDRFGDLWEAARSGGLEHWVDGTPGTLAYLILCDQFPRNIHRNTALAFATDPQALAAAHKALAAGWDLDAPEPARQFFYMPFEHSEDVRDQAIAIAMLTDRMASDPEMALHARAHAEIIRIFGRFPFRNAVLGRTPTAAEAEFMAQGAYPEFVRRMRD